jgi:hypothetical protein
VRAAAASVVLCSSAATATAAPVLAAPVRPVGYSIMNIQRFHSGCNYVHFERDKNSCVADNNYTNTMTFEEQKIHDADF